MHARIGKADRGITEEGRDTRFDWLAAERWNASVDGAAVDKILIAQCCARTTVGGQKGQRRMNAVSLQANPIAKKIRVFVDPVQSSGEPVAESLTDINGRAAVVVRAALQHQLTKRS